MGMGRAYKKMSKKDRNLLSSIILFPLTALFEIAKFIISAPFILLFGVKPKKKRR